MSHLKAILFDFDDTLVQTYKVRSQAHKEAGRVFYGLDITDEKIQQAWGKPYREMLGIIYGDVEPIDQIDVKYKSISTKYPIPAEDGAIETIVALATNYIQGIVTAADWQLIEPTFRSLNWPLEHFFQIQTAEQTKYHKPDPRVFEPIIKDLNYQGISRSEILYIGDAVSDLFASVEAGLNFLGVTTGLTPATEFASYGATTIGSLSHLPSYLSQF